MFHLRQVRLAGAVLWLVLQLGCGFASAQEMHILPVQREGQASVTVIDLSKSGDGNQVMIYKKPLLDFVSVEKKVAESRLTDAARHRRVHRAADQEQLRSGTYVLALAKSWKLKTETLAALDEGILDDE